jgi:hypothetical protein
MPVTRGRGSVEDVAPLHDREVVVALDDRELAARQRDGARGTCPSQLTRQAGT